MRFHNICFVGKVVDTPKVGKRMTFIDDSIKRAINEGREIDKLATVARIM